jgi:hypothetical protein
MFTALRHKVRDIGTITQLSSAAERIARSHGVSSPGSEHFVLAALDLKDGTAQQAFGRLNLTRDAFNAAIGAQFAAALRHAGVHADPAGPGEPGAPRSRPEAGPAPKVYTAGASGQALMQRLAASRGARAGRPLLGADVLLAASEEVLSSTARAFRHLGVLPEQLRAAAVEAAGCWSPAEAGT